MKRSDIYTGILLSVLIGLILGGCIRSSNTPQDSTGQKPNIMIIMADDMGFSDPGCYGGEINTPNLDKLAENGIRFTQFYNTGRCCPTRASLLTGLYAHQTGMGWMTAADLGHPGYTGDLNKQCVTIAEALKEAGYSTYMTGKWHVVADKKMKPEGPKENWPLQRGFDRYFGPVNGGGSYFTTKYLTCDNERVEPPDGFYVTDAISDTAVLFIHDHLKGGKISPFFLYVAYTAPHFPLHAKPEDIAKYEGRYMKGWDKLKTERYERQLKMGLIDSIWQLSLPGKDIVEWESLSQSEKVEFDRRMAIYAAQIDCMDKGIGRIISALKNTGQLNNTLVMFLSDNGGTAEYISRGSPEIGQIGTDDSYESYRKPWATLSNTPFRMFKQWVHEGGIATPLIVHWPEKIKAGEIRKQVGHVIDLLPTCLEVAKAEYPEEYSGNRILPFEGFSLVSAFFNEELDRNPIFWEHQATRAVRIGDWKLVADKETNMPPYILEWELYNLFEDRSEMNNLADEYPERVAQMDSVWNAWAERCHVLPLDGRGWFERLDN